MKSVHFYLIKIISVIGFIFNCFTLVGAYYAYNMIWFYKNIPTIVILGTIVGIIGLVGSLGLFLFKRWGFYTLIIFVPFFWITTLITWALLGKISATEWIFLLIWSLIFVYLVWQRKTILNYGQ